MSTDLTQDIYDPHFVRDVFDRCSIHYRWWSQVASFGIITLWRRQCVDHMPPLATEGSAGLDLMAGTGEAWPYLLRRLPSIASVTAVDISSEMNRRALDRLHRTRSHRIRLVEANVLENTMPSASADFIISTFGLKTFNQSQQKQLAGEIARLLKPGGVFSLIEASDPKAWSLHGLYRFYLDNVLPLIEKTVLRRAQDFSMIGAYTNNFGDCRHIAACLAQAGLDVEFKSFFFGCATAVVGRKR